MRARIFRSVAASRTRSSRVIAPLALRGHRSPWLSCLQPSIRDARTSSAFSGLTSPKASRSPFAVRSRWPRRAYGCSVRDISSPRCKARALKPRQYQFAGWWLPRPAHTPHPFWLRVLLRLLALLQTPFLLGVLCAPFVERINGRRLRCNTCVTFVRSASGPMSRIVSRRSARGQRLVNASKLLSQRPALHRSHDIFARNDTNEISPLINNWQAFNLVLG